MPCSGFRETVVNAYKLLHSALHDNNSALRFIVVYKVPSCTYTLSKQIFKAINDLIPSNRTRLLCGDIMIQLQYGLVLIC